MSLTLMRIRHAGVGRLILALPILGNILFLGLGIVAVAAQMERGFSVILAIVAITAMAAGLHRERWEFDLDARSVARSTGIVPFQRRSLWSLDHVLAVRYEQFYPGSVTAVVAPGEVPDASERADTGAAAHARMRLVFSEAEPVAGVTLDATRGFRCARMREVSEELAEALGKPLELLA